MIIKASFQMMCNTVVLLQGHKMAATGLSVFFDGVARFNEPFVICWLNWDMFP